MAGRDMRQKMNGNMMGAQREPEEHDEGKGRGGSLKIMKQETRRKKKRQDYAAEAESR